MEHTPPPRPTGDTQQEIDTFNQRLLRLAEIRARELQHHIGQRHQQLVNELTGKPPLRQRTDFSVLVRSTLHGVGQWLLERVLVEQPAKPDFPVVDEKDITVIEGDWTDVTDSRKDNKTHGTPNRMERDERPGTQPDAARPAQKRGTRRHPRRRTGDADGSLHSDSGARSDTARD
jgi:hypothetical protein